jgi:hypothetical protein
MLNPNTSLQLHGSQVIRFRIHQSWTPGVFFEQKKDMHQTSFSVHSEKRAGAPVTLLGKDEIYNVLTEFHR